MTTLMNLYGEEERRITGVLFISSHSFLKKHTYWYVNIITVTSILLSSTRGLRRVL
jgi:hypothetical protein